MDVSRSRRAWREDQQVGRYRDSAGHHVGDPVTGQREPDSPDLEIAKLLLDYAKLCGFEFERVAGGEDAPLVGHRVTGGWEDEIRLDGFSHGCFARRKRRSSLIVPNNVLVERRVDGSALKVLGEVLTWGAEV